MTTFKNVLGTPQVVIAASDIETIFHKIPEIHHAHKMFVYQLTLKLENWSPEQQIGDIFKTLVRFFCVKSCFGFNFWLTINSLFVSVIS